MRLFAMMVLVTIPIAGSRAAEPVGPASPTVSSAAPAAPNPSLNEQAVRTPTFLPRERAVSTWRSEAVKGLALTPEQAGALGDAAATAPPVARCVKLNNYWCIKKAGWNGEIAADGEGHVAFASAGEGAAVAALLLKRYYVDFHRRTALAIVSHWAPPSCGGAVARSGAPGAPGTLATLDTLGTLTGLAGTLRGRWLAGHDSRLPARRSAVRSSKVPDRIARPAPPAAIVADTGEARPMTLDALLASTPGMPPSRSMIGGWRAPARPSLAAAKTEAPKAGAPKAGAPKSGAPKAGAPVGAVASSVTRVRVVATACTDDSGRIAAYAARAAAGITPAADGDLGLFAPDGTPTGNLRILMANMAQVEIGPLGVSPTLVEAGIADAFRPGRNPDGRTPGKS